MAKDSIRAVLLAVGSGGVSTLASGDRETVLKAAKEISRSGLPAGASRVEAWDQNTGRIYSEDGSRCPAPVAKKAAKKATKRVYGSLD